MLNIPRIELEEKLKDIKARLIVAEKEHQKVLLKLFLATDAEERYWRRMEYWHSGLYLTRLKCEIHDLEEYLKKTPAPLLITEGVTYG